MPPNTANQDDSPETRIAGWYNDAVIALDVLYEQAVGGSCPAQQKLRVIAEELLQAAAKLKYGEK